MIYHIIGSDSYISKRFFSNYKNKLNIKLLSRNCDDKKNIIDLNYPNDFDFKTIEKDDSVIFFAAISSPDECEKNKEYAYNINVTATKIFIENCINRGARILFFSSDVVYGNTNIISDEKTPTAPFGNYAIMKNEVENYFKNSDLLKIFRLSYVWSHDDKYTKYLVNCAIKNEIAEVFNSLFRNVVYINDVTDAINNLFLTWDYWDNQIFNICGVELLSRLDIARYLKEEVYTNLKYKCVEPGSDFYKNRIKSISIKSIYFEKLLNKPITFLKDVMKSEFTSGGYCDD
jgi:dTDP-4-dehydrorhamnose reductase